MNLNKSFFQEQQQANKSKKKVSPDTLHNLGLSGNQELNIENTLDDLRKTIPNIVIAKSTIYVEFEQNFFQMQRMLKKHRYIMASGVYQQLQYSPQFINKKVLKPSSIKFKNIYRPYQGEDLSNKTLFVSRTGGIGDLLFIKPNLEFLKKQYPTCNIKFACGPQYQDMLKNWDCIDKVYDLPIEFIPFMNADYHAIFEGVIERCKEAETTNAYELFTRWLNLNLPPELLIPSQEPEEDIVEKCKEILKGWDILGEKFFITQIRASSPIRTPSTTFWTTLFDKLVDKGYHIIVSDSPFQEENIQKFIDSFSRPNYLHNFTKKSENLKYLIAMISLANLSISTDSALIHISQSVNTPAFGIYGPFPGNIRLSTYKNVDWVDAKRSCAPCFIHSLNPCPNSVNGISPCYNNINIDEVVERIERLI